MSLSIFFIIVIISVPGNQGSTGHPIIAYLAVYHEIRWVSRVGISQRVLDNVVLLGIEKWVTNWEMSDEIKTGVLFKIRSKIIQIY
jgi:hypothetical protein